MLKALHNSESLQASALLVVVLAVFFTLGVAQKYCDVHHLGYINAGVLSSTPIPFNQ
jgi:hypothetical protein